MKYMKITSIVAGISLLATTLLPGTASAASAVMSLSGATQANGTFSTVVYENADGPVSSVKLALNFSAAVSSVSYDYSAGPFTATDPDGYHLSQGIQTGTQPVARVSFTLADPGTVIASINTGGSVVKGTNAEKTAVVYYTVGSASANFTYTAPATGGQGGGSSTGSTGSTGSNSSAGSASSSSAAANGTTKVATGSTNTSNGTSAASGETKDASTTAASDDSKKAISGSTTKTDATKTADKKSGSKAWLWILLAVIVAAAAALAARKKLTTGAQNAQASK